MQRVIVRRLLQGLVTLWVLSIIVFALGRLAGDPLELLLPDDATEEQFVQARKTLGLDKPLSQQYGIFVINALKGDFGRSLRTRVLVMELVLHKAPNSMSLAGVALGFAIVVGFPLGMLAAIKRGTWIDTLATVVALLGITMPSFWVAMLLMQLFAVTIGVLPTSGMGGPQHYILPGVSLGLIVLGGLVRLVRSSMIDTLDSEFIKLARIKGLPERMVIWKHALRNGLIAPITYAGMYFALLITMAVVIETVYAWPGLGRLAYEAVMSRDYPVIQAVVLLGGALVIAVNLVVDVVYAYIDPRIRTR